MWTLALVSYFINKTMRLYIFFTAFIFKIFSQKEDREWGSGTEKMLNNPNGILLPCVIGPRWNCHAMLVRLGPFRVERSIKVNADQLTSAESWTAVIYDNKYRTIANSNETNIEQEMPVSPGYYTIILRYYSDDSDVSTPSVHVDGQLLAETTRIKDEKARYTRLLDSIKGKKSFFYFMLHYYVFYLLKYHDRFPTGLVRKEFLPAGNPETTFLYGYIAKGGLIKISCEQEIFKNSLVFLTVYNEASFPQAWAQVTEENFSYGEIYDPGAYLVRIVPKQGCVVDSDKVKTMTRVSCE